jgi:hypothetical protein
MMFSRRQQLNNPKKEVSMLKEMNEIKTGCKFIVAFVGEQKVVRASETVGYLPASTAERLLPIGEGHYGIYKKLLAEAGGQYIHVLGGGRIKVVEEEKIVYIWGDSGNFQRESDWERRNITAQIVQRAFPGYKIIIDVIPRGEAPH